MYIYSMPMITIYVPKELYEALRRHPNINRSAVSAKALKKAIAATKDGER